MGLGTGREDGSDARGTETMKIFATEDGSRPTGRKRGRDDRTAAKTAEGGARGKKKKKRYDAAFAAVLARRSGTEVSAAAAAEETRAETRAERGDARAKTTNGTKRGGKGGGGTKASLVVVEPDAMASEKGKKVGKKSNASAPPPKRTYWKKVNLDGEIFAVGDSAYVVNSKTEDFDEDEDALCMVCRDPVDDDRVMLECDMCLTGWHMCCLRPPLTNVPESDWSCPLCTRESASVSAMPQLQNTSRSACGEFLAGRMLLARIEHIWEENGTYQYAARWYTLPEDTHMGRQPMQHRREVFLSHTVDVNAVDSLFRVAKVCTPQEFRDEEGNGNDTYVCEYTYDEAFQRFKRRGEWGEEDDFSDDERFDNELNWNDDDEDWDAKRTDPKKGSKKGQRSALTAMKRAKDMAASLEIAGFGGSALGRGRKHPATVFGGVRAVLSLASTPATLPCRENERKQVYDFVLEAIMAGPNSTGKCLYISGVPGTGKTATVREIARVLRSQARTHAIPKFNYIELNALRLQTPKHAYSTIAEELMGQRFSPEKGCMVLDKRFKEGKGSDGRVTVLVVDELDLLVTHKQDVLYNIFDWPTHKKSRLVVIGIANTLDVPERMLPRIASRLGSNRVSFAPYTWDQLKTIVTSRLESVEGCSDAFATSTLDLICRKVASVNGDARRALELARRAAEVAEARINVEKVTNISQPITASNGGADARVKARNEKVTMDDVRQAQSEMFDGPHMKLIHAASFYERMFLIALAKEIQRSGTQTVTMGGVMEMLRLICKSPKVSVPEPPIGSGVRIASRLRSTHLIMTDASTSRNLQQVSLSIPVADITFALVENCENSDMPWCKDIL